MNHVRRARPEDVPAIARVHVEGWRWGYRGLLPDSYLDGLAPEQRLPMWTRVLAGADPLVWVADQGDAVVGVAFAGPARDLQGTAELYVLYVTEAVAGTGVGHALAREVAAALGARGFAEAVLWVLATNARARRFYERQGWAPDGADKDEEVGGQPARHVRYRVALPGADGYDPARRSR